MKVGVLISGRGSNLKALLDHQQSGEHAFQVACVLSDKADAPGLDHARQTKTPTAVIERADHADRDSFDQAMTDTLRQHDVDLVVLAGYMRIIGSKFIDHWFNRLINIHPSLLPSFRGLNTHQRAIAENVRFHGCTVHMVRTELDTGPIIGQAALPVQPDEQPEALAARVLAMEHILFARCLDHLACGHVRVEGDQVIWRRDSSSDLARSSTGLFFPNADPVIQC